MKKTYIQPQLKVVAIKSDYPLLGKNSEPEDAAYVFSRRADFADEEDNAETTSRAWFED